MRRLPPLVAALALLGVAGCVTGTSSCTPTTTTARRADRVNVSVVSRSAVIEATLRTASGPVPSRTLAFEVLDDGASVYDADAATGANGVARVDLKRADAAALLALVRADEFQATFAGDATYCTSSGRAPFRAVRA